MTAISQVIIEFNRYKRSLTPRSRLKLNEILKKKHLFNVEVQVPRSQVTN